MTNAPSGTAACDAGVDVDTIRHTYESVLWRWGSLPEGDHDPLAELLLGHVQLLVPEVTDLASRMQGEQQRTAEYVLIRTRRVLARNVVEPQAQASHLWDLAMLCRALLTLHQHPGPLNVAAVKSAGAGRRS